MRKRILGALLLGVTAAPAMAVSTENYQIPYFGAGVSYLLTDTVRDAEGGEGLQFTLGVPLDNPTNAIEVRASDFGYKRVDEKKNYQSSLFVDYVRDFSRAGESGLKPFGSLGLGFVQEDVYDDKHIHFGAALGGGAMLPIGFKGWAVRLEGRVQGQMNKETCEPKPTIAMPCTERADLLVDYQLSLGVQIPLTIFFDRPVPIAPADECPVKVVDPLTGRRDCAADSDRDGVDDAVDYCPGTPSGTKVDTRGCPTTRAGSDSDFDGVADAQDKCAATQAGFRVDAAGCVIPQNASIGGITFEPDTSRLTAQGRETLNGVAATLASQPTLQVEIAGHTDAVGSDAYNTLLSQQRADAIRGYLIEKGVVESRLVAVGYGEAEPVASNETEEGRLANRRIEFRIGTS